MQYKLSVPVKFDGEEITELSLNFTNLNIPNYNSALAEFKVLNPLHQGEIGTSIKFTKFIIAKLIDKPVIFMGQLPVKDSVALRYSYFNEIRRIRSESETLTLNLDKLTTRDYELAEDRFMAKNPQFAGAIEVEDGFINEILLLSSDLTVDSLEQLGFGTYLKAKEEVTNFLFSYFTSSLLMNSESHA